MFLHWRQYRTTGIIKNENYGSPELVSGLKTFTSPSYLSGTARFVIGSRGKTIRPSKDGRTEIEHLETYFGLDEINTLSGIGITLTYGQTKLVYDGSEYRLVEVSNYGQDIYNKSFVVGMLRAIFSKETSHGSY